VRCNASVLLLFLLVLMLGITDSSLLLVVKEDMDVASLLFVPG
jgi:glycosylphosphatidylinositol transamidase (GPIT) subunit GPI8